MTFKKGYTPHNKGNKKRFVEISCLHCNIKKLKLKSEIKRGYGKYCSQRCSALHQFRKKSNLDTDPPKSKHRLNKLLCEWHKQQGRTKCGIPNCNFYLVLELHRIKPGKEGGKYTKDNTILLCPNHHSLITKKINTLTELCQ